MSDLQPRGIPYTVGGVERNFLFTLAAVDEIQAKYDLPVSQVMAKLADDREVYDTIAVLATILINDEIRRTVTVEEDLREISMGAWDGLTFSEIKERFPEFF